MNVFRTSKCSKKKKKSTAHSVVFPFPSTTTLSLCDQIPSMSQVLRNLKEQFCMAEFPRRTRAYWSWASQKTFTSLKGGISRNILTFVKHMCMFICSCLSVICWRLHRSASNINFGVYQWGVTLEIGAVCFAISLNNSVGFLPCIVPKGLGIGGHSYMEMPASLTKISLEQNSDSLACFLNECNIEHLKTGIFKFV